MKPFHLEIAVPHFLIKGAESFIFTIKYSDTISQLMAQYPALKLDIVFRLQLWSDADHLDRLRQVQP